MWGRTVSFGLALVSTVACSEVSEPLPIEPADASSADTVLPEDAPTEEAGLPVEGTLIVRVVEPHPYWLDGATTPIPDAIVGGELPGLGLVEGKTDTSGRVTFEKIDWSQLTHDKPATVTAYAPGHTMLSFVGIDEQGFIGHRDGEIVLTLPSLEPPPTVELTGRAINITEFSPFAPSALLVSVVPGQSFYEAVGGPEFKLQVPKGLAFTLIAIRLEEGSCYSCVHLSWTTLDHGPIHESQPDPVTIDFADPLPTVHVVGELEIPGTQYTPYLSMYTQVNDSSGFVGVPSAIVTSPLAVTSTAYYEMEYVLWNRPGRVITNYVVQAGQRASFRSIAGYPQGGRIEGLPKFPNVLQPADRQKPAPIVDPISWEADEYDTAEILISREIDYLWRVVVQEATARSLSTAQRSQLVLPKVPPNVDLTAILGSQPLFFQLLTCSLDEAGPVPARILTAREHRCALSYQYQVMP